ncbi:hypothetical protein ACFQ6U_05960 [Streptomyces sp. NPDC056465]|uniref:hypothetical protein n=1 Tax=Streptomyces sp. NPDC056465 TaxID=3345829 RepID=UPI00369E0BA7
MISNAEVAEAVDSDLIASGMDDLLSGKPLEGALAMNRPISPYRIYFTEIVNKVESRLGPPDLYAGGAAGVIVRWHHGQSTLTVTQEQRVTMSLRSAASLSASEATAFRSGVGTRPGQASSYLELPYLWRVVRRGSALEQPSVPPTSDWNQLEQSLRCLLELWVEQTSLLYNAGWCDEVAFDVSEQVSGDRVLGLLQSAEDGLALFLHDHRATTAGPPPNDLVARGWQHRVRQFRAWIASFDPGPGTAEIAAGIIVRELRLRGAATPLSVALTALSSNGESRLQLPGVPLKKADHPS